MRVSSMCVAKNLQARGAFALEHEGTVVFVSLLLLFDDDDGAYVNAIRWYCRRCS